MSEIELTPLQLKTLMLLAEGPQTSPTKHEAHPLVKPCKWLVSIGLASVEELPPVRVREGLWRHPRTYRITAKGRDYFAGQATLYRRLSTPADDDVVTSHEAPLHRGKDETP